MALTHAETLLKLRSELQAEKEKLAKLIAARDTANANYNAAVITQRTWSEHVSNKCGRKRSGCNEQELGVDATNFRASAKAKENLDIAIKAVNDQNTIVNSLTSALQAESSKTPDQIAQQDINATAVDVTKIAEAAKNSRIIIFGVIALVIIIVVIVLLRR